MEESGAVEGYLGSWKHPSPVPASSSPELFLCEFRKEETVKGKHEKQKRWEEMPPEFITA